MSDYIQPEVNADAFHCPTCGSFSDQFWYRLTKSNSSGGVIPHQTFFVGNCRRCGNVTIWNNEKNMVYPLTGNAPIPNQDMTEDIKIDYNEARDIVSRSPRSSCVLLRLCIEKICNEKGAKGKDLNEKIGKLVEQGLNADITRALDSVRVIGGQAVHPLKMDLRDDTTTATSLFKIVNYISDWAHTRKKVIDDIFDDIPDEKKKAIEKRDSK